MSKVFLSFFVSSTSENFFLLLIGVCSSSSYFLFPLKFFASYDVFLFQFSLTYSINIVVTVFRSGGLIKMSQSMSSFTINVN